MCGIFALLNYYDDMNMDAGEVHNSFMKGISRGPEMTTDLIPLPNRVTFGFHRLAINGLSNSSSQPIAYDNIYIICNGEIYNYKELYSYLDIEPVTKSDCEVIIHVYMKYGIEYTLQILDGVFSFVLLDMRKPFEPIIFVARDPYGVRPLFILHDNRKSHRKSSNLIGFASELKMLCDINDCPRRYLHQHRPGTYSSFLHQNEQWFCDSECIRYTSLPFSTNMTTVCMSGIFETIRTKLCQAVYKRVHTTERPIACLLSGGLDSSLIAALVNRYSMMYSGKPIETYSIGLAGSPDIEYASKVATYIGSTHREIIVSEQSFFDAIPEVIKVLESYDTTTVRASVGNYLVCKYIQENSEAKVVFNGDGADELMGGYLYFYHARDAIDFDKECRRLMTNIHYYDVLRSDRTISSNGLEARTPFLDRDWVQYYMSIHMDIRYHPGMQQQEKYLVRKAFDCDFEFIDYTTKKSDHRPLLPREVLYRTKEAFSDGVSVKVRSWYEIIQEKVGELLENSSSGISRYDLPKYHYSEHGRTRLTQEQSYYKYLFDLDYSGCGSVIPSYWMPRFVDAKDASARSLNIYTNITSIHNVEGKDEEDEKK